MSDNDKLQEQLAEALEHNEDHPVAKEEYEIPEDVLLMMEIQNKIRKSQASFNAYLEEQAKIWGFKQ